MDVVTTVFEAVAVVLIAAGLAVLTAAGLPGLLGVGLGLLVAGCVLGLASFLIVARGGDDR